MINLIMKFYGFQLLKVWLGIVFIFLCGCSGSDSDPKPLRAVVEGYVQAGKPFEVKITKENGFGESTSTQALALTGLTVTLNTADGNYKLTNIADGRYAADELLVVKENSTYNLSFNYDNQLVTTSTQVPTKPNGLTQSATSISIPQINFSSGGPPSSLPTFPDPVKISWNNPDGKYHLVVVENIETDPESVTSGDRPPFTFRNQPSTSSSYEITAQAFSYFGRHRIIVFKLNPEYAALYQSSNNSSLNLNNPQTNIENGLGIFTGINSDTLFIRVTKQ